MTLERVGPEAAGRLAVLHAEVFDRPWAATELAALLAASGALALASQNGFILVRQAGPEAEVLTLAVTPAARRQGCGRALLDAAIRLAGEHGVETVFLEVATDNDAALALYERAGFERVGLRRGYHPRADGAVVDAFTLRLALSSALPSGPG